jgi:hypothetical protein
VPHLRPHILKEDRVLYPRALQMLTGPELDAISGEFEAFERRLRADGTFDRLQSLADALVAGSARIPSGWRPRPACRTAAASHPRPLRCGGRDAGPVARPGPHRYDRDVFPR